MEFDVGVIGNVAMERLEAQEGEGVVGRLLGGGGGVKEVLFVE